MQHLVRTARPHHLRWVRAGALVTAGGYLLSVVVTILSQPDALPNVLTDISGLVACSVAALLAWRGRTAAAAYLVLATLWLELHASVVLDGRIESDALPVLPVYVAGAGLLAGGPVGLWLAALTSVTYPAAVLLGAWVQTGHATLGLGGPGTVAVLAATMLGMAVLVHLGLHSFGTVLREADENQRRFAEIVNNAPDGMVALDAEGRVRSLNPAALRLLGRAEPGTVFDDLVRRAAPAGRDAVASLLRGRAESATITLPSTGEGDLTLELTARRSSRTDGQSGTQLMLRDVSYRARAEDERRRLEERLQHAQRLEAIGQLAGGVAHDFNNLLQALYGNLDLLRLTIGAGHPGEPYLREIEKASRRGGELTRQLLAFARKGMVEPDVVDLNAVLLEVDPMLRRLIPADISLSIETARELDRVRVDSGQFEQVVVNLVLNACDAMPGGGLLTISTCNVRLDAEAAAAAGLTAGEYVRLDVADTGVGMPPGVLARVFEPFFTTKPAGQGSGLGLATSFGIVAQADGHIAVRSEEGRGTTFSVLLPRSADAAAPRRRVSPARPAAASGGTETVLVVEDEDQVRAVTVRCLGAHGYRVLEAAAGDDALEVSRAWEGPIHLLVTDVVLPAIGGKDLAAALAAERPGIAVLFVSGYAEDAIVHRGVLEPGLEFLAKPFTPSELALRVRSVLDSRRAQPGGP